MMSLCLREHAVHGILWAQASQCKELTVDIPAAGVVDSRAGVRVLASPAVRRNTSGSGAYAQLCAVSPDPGQRNARGFLQYIANLSEAMQHRIGLKFNLASILACAVCMFVSLAQSYAMAMADSTDASRTGAAAQG
jgi:hypothetical protein